MGDGREHDAVDDRIRALVSDAVASAPPPPTVDEVRDGGLPVAPVSPVPSGGAHGSRPALSTRGRTVRTVVAYAAVVVLILAGVRAVDGRGDDRTVMPADALPVRYVPTEVPNGLELTDAETGAAPDPGPGPDVEVYERDDGARLRIAAGPPDWAARASVLGPMAVLPAATTTTGLATSTTGPPGTTTAPSSTTTEPTSSGSTTSTTTAPTPGVPGLPARPDILPETVRGGPGGVEAHDPTTTTVWFGHEGRLVAVDVYGLDRTGALGIVERMTPGVGGGLVPGPGDAFRRVAETEAGPTGRAGDEPPAMARLVYTADGHRDGGPAFVVTTVRLHQQEGGAAAALLTATAGSFGRIDRWGDRQVLVDDGLDDGATTLVSFVDPAGVVVTVLVSALGPTDDLATYVDGLVPADERAWERVAAE